MISKEIQAEAKMLLSGLKSKGTLNIPALENLLSKVVEYAPPSGGRQQKKQDRIMKYAGKF